MTDPRRHFSLQLKFGVQGAPTAVSVVVALTNLSGGKQMGSFLTALHTAVADPVAGAVLIRPNANLTLGPKTDARKKYDALKDKGKLRPFELTEHRPAFEQMECYLRLLDRAGQKDLVLGQKAVTADKCRQLAVKTQVLAGLDLFEKVCGGWVQTATAPAKATPPPPPATVQPSVDGISQPGASSQSQIATATKVSPPPVAPPVPSGDGADWADKLLRAVAEKLTEFGQRVEPTGVQIGPTFARLMLKPLGRTSVGRVRNYANDLRAHIAEIKIVPIISDQPGYISVDVQRPDPQPVRLEDLLSQAPQTHNGRPIFPVGVDVTGKPYWLDLSDSSTCHVLAAGTTGSGKSEFLKAMLAGLAARLSSLELQFLLVDPKRVTFNFPHASPYMPRAVAHDVDETMPLIEEMVGEMDRRYALLQQRGLEHVGQLTGPDALPRWVVVFDEFADLMADRKTKQKLEDHLKRIGALARASGIHLVLATQRPDKDVVTPLLKANLPTRVCLRVDGERNSKIILDEEGGENLLGRGDLFWKFGGGMMRLQGAYVSREELEKSLKMER